jgi:hypothetical protein
VPVLDIATRFRLESAVRRALDLPERDGDGRGRLDDIRAEVECNDGLIVLGGEADDTLSWLRTGEGLTALWIRATRSGLSVVPLSRPVEVPTTRAELRAQLPGDLQPHLLVRIGWQAMGRSILPHTPRRPVNEVLRP